MKQSELNKLRGGKITIPATNNPNHLKEMSNEELVEYVIRKAFTGKTGEDLKQFHAHKAELLRRLKITPK